MPSNRSRRTLLRRVAAATVLATAGCLSDSGTDGPTPDTDGPPNGDASASETASLDGDAPDTTGSNGRTPGTNGSDDGTGTASTAETTGTGTPVPRSALSDESATERALAAEESYLTTQLRRASCLEDWGTSPTVVNEAATVTDRRADGVYVEVRHPYWYSTANAEADGGSEARYRVGPNVAERVDGDRLSPC